MSSLPPALAVGALYDTFLQNALKQFFGRATFETEPMLSASSDGRLSIEPSDDPCALTIRWFGTRYTLRVPEHRPFTVHETRFARAIGSVLAARYRAILHPKLMIERGELFRGAIEDRYVGAFLDDAPYATADREPRADRIAQAIEVMRVAALSSYENRPISTGVLLLEDDDNPVAAAGTRVEGAPYYTQALTGVKSFFRLVDGVRTLFLVGRSGMLLDIVDVEHWADQVSGDQQLPVPCPAAYQAHARATLGNKHVGIALSPSHEIKVFAEGAQVLAYRHATWALLDLQRKYDLWAEAVGNRMLAQCLFRSALDLGDERHGALFVVARDPGASVPTLVSAADRLDIAKDGAAPAMPPTRRDLLSVLTGRRVTDLDATVLAALASLDGATVIDRDGNLIAVGAILRHPSGEPIPATGIVEGARTTAAISASRHGPVLKISEDGGITFFDGVKIWDL